MTQKPKFAMYWAASCGGCEIAVLNIHEKILDVDKNFEVVFWPVAMDAKYKDVEQMQDGEILLTLFNGSIRNQENEHMAQLLRRKSKLLVAFGSCANEGCIPGLANLSTAAQIFDTAYSTPSTDNPQGIRPQFQVQVAEGTLTIPVFNPVLRPLAQVVDVDYYIPGCPPESHQIAAVIDVVIAVLEGKAELPPKGSFLGVGDSTVCDECPRTRNEKQVRQFTRIQEMKEIDPNLCLLEQGLVCNGPATASGCGALCPAAGATCAGCYGPPLGVLDAGARMISSLASIVDEHDPRKIDITLDDLVDPTGVFYRFGLAGSLLQTGKASWNKN
ncbi:MAG: F420-nonreducing hydrogenase [Anaerolineales bacterium]